MTKRLLIIGAAGDVGQGIVSAASARGWQVAAAGRSAAKLDALASRLPGITPITGDLGSPETAAR